MSPAASIVNDCSICVATVNGSGSQSANNILLKTLFRMGIPSGAKNLFPSNIQGLPTWYTIRINKNGYIARKKDLDIIVAMNPATWLEDHASAKKGGVIIHPTELPVTSQMKRDDVTYYAIPFKKLAEENFTEIKLRKLLTNMIYVGVLAELLGIDLNVLTKAVNDNFASKAKVVESNLKAVQVGMDYVKANLKKADPYSVAKMNENKDKIVMDGNNAAALGCLYGGCTMLAWYPITPSSSVCESLIDYMEDYRVAADGTKNFAAVQAEDEIAAIGMVLGAGWAGARAMTATSGPGISLMAEFTGYGYFTEIPAVIFDIQRTGPSTGLPTRTMQGDIGFVNTLSHGDTRHPMLIPGNPVECYEFAQQAFDMADRLQTPIFVMSDLDLGMNMWSSEKFKMPTKPFDRGKVLDAAGLEKAGKFDRYKDVDGDAIPYRTLPGTNHKLASYFTRGSGHNEAAKYSEKPEDYVYLVDRLTRKYQTAKKYVPTAILKEESGAEVGILAFGSTDLAIAESQDFLKKSGLKTNYLRVRALPFNEEVKEFYKKNKRVYVVEQNRDGQMAEILNSDLGPEMAMKTRSVRYYDGLPIDAESISEGILKIEKGV